MHFCISRAWTGRRQRWACEGCFRWPFLQTKEGHAKRPSESVEEGRFLPVAIPLVSFGEPCWVQTWLELGKQQGLVVAKGAPLLPSPTYEGGWDCQSHTSCGEQGPKRAAFTHTETH